jgi:ferritin-like metal-binding protein YciE
MHDRPELSGEAAMLLELMNGTLLHRLQEIYLAERELMRAWGELLARSHNREIAVTVARNQRFTEQQLARLEDCLGVFNSRPRELLDHSYALAQATEVAGLEMELGETRDALEPGVISIAAERAKRRRQG